MGLEAKLLGVLTKFFKDVDPRIRGFAYVVLLLLFVFLVTRPDVISGRVVMEDKDGANWPYPGQAVHTTYAQHYLKFRTNDDGFWVIPAPIWSTDIEIDLAEFLNVKGELRMRTVEIGAIDYWFRDEVKIILSDKKPIIRIEPRFAAIKGFSSKVTQFAEQLFSKRAYAGSLGPASRSPVAQQLEEAVFPPEAPGFPGIIEPAAPTGEPRTLPWQKEDIAKSMAIGIEVRNAINRVTKLPSEEITDDFMFRDHPEFSFRQRVKVINTLEKEFQFRIPYEHWNDLKNVGELTKYILDRKNIYDQYNLDKSQNWYDIRRQIPEKERPVYKK